MSGKRNHTGHRLGEWHHRAKLSDAEVRALRSAYEAREGGYLVLSRRFVCGQSTVRDIVQRRTRFTA
jgi:hypothetical protein